MKTTDLGKDSIFSIVLKLAIPSMLAQFVNVLYTIIDRMFIGNIPQIGEIALAGIGVCGPIAAFLASFGNLIGIGGSVYMAMKMGAGDNKKAEEILSNSFSFLIIMSFVLTTIFLVFRKQMVIWFGASSETFGYASQYLAIYASGSVFAIVALGMNYFITGQGFATVAMISVVIGAVANIVLDYIFVFVLNLQVAGAAWATVISQFMSCAWTLAFLTGKRVHISLKKHKLSGLIAKKIVSLGFPAFIMYATDSVILIVLNVVLQHYGGAEMGDMLISAATIVQSYGLIVLSPLGGITAGTQAVLSYNYGAKNKERVIKSFAYISAMAVAFCTVMFVISRFAPQYYVQFFTKDKQLADMAVWGIKAYTLGLIPLALHYEATDGLTALGKAHISVCMSAFRKGTFVLLVCLIPLFMPPQYTFVAQSVGDGVCGIINTVICIFILKHILNTMENEEI
ncbi:MAG: MATE family efflux transporter [Ruminococcaceae bacterium]|nr:MATE family efflux transporter [Oscillospiraceae bacterium]